MLSVSFVVLFLVAVSRAQTQEGFSWVAADMTDFQVPWAVLGGFDTDGKPSYVIRSLQDGVMVPGKLIPMRPGCYIPYNGTELTMFYFEVLTMTTRTAIWVKESNGAIPLNAIPISLSSSGNNLYSCRFNHPKSLVMGKIEEGVDTVCYIPLDGEKYTSDTYEVLVKETS